MVHEVLVEDPGRGCPGIKQVLFLAFRIENIIVQVKVSLLRGSKYLLFLACAVCLTTFTDLRFCSAQSAPREFHLFTGAAEAKANERSSRHAKNYGLLSAVAPAGHSSGPSLADEVKLDTVEGVLSSQKEAAMMSELRGLSYLRYVENIVDVTDWVDPQDQSSFARTLLVYQTAKTLVHTIIESPLEPTYRKVVKQVRALDHYTTVQVVEGSRGKLGVKQGETVSGNRLVSFKLHLSVQNGVEPRLLFGDHLVLRYDPFHQDTVFQFETHF